MSSASSAVRRHDNDHDRDQERARKKARPQESGLVSEAGIADLKALLDEVHTPRLTTTRQTTDQTMTYAKTKDPTERTITYAKTTEHTYAKTTEHAYANPTSTQWDTIELFYALTE